MNDARMAWFDDVGTWIWHVSWQASLLAAGVVCLQRLLKSGLTPRIRHALWLVVLARLVLPWIPASPWSPYLLFQPRSTAPQKAPQVAAEWAATPAPPDGHASWKTSARFTRTETSAPSSKSRSSVKIERSDIGPRPNPVSGTVPRFSVARCCWCVWACGSTLLVATTTFRWWRFRSTLRRSATTAPPELERLLATCGCERGWHGPVRLVITPDVPAPAVMGWWRPRVLLPPWVVDSLSLHELRLVFLHELTHVRRHDVAIAWLVEWLRAVHWFNPWLWRCFGWMRRARELACDQSVLRCLTREEQRLYGRTILRVLELVAGRHCSWGAVPAGAAGLTFWTSKERLMLEERIRLVATASRRPRRGQLVLGAIIVVLVALCGLTDAQQPPATSAAVPSKVTSPEPTDTPTAISQDRATTSNRATASRVLPRTYPAPQAAGAIPQPAPIPQLAVETRDSETPELLTTTYAMKEVLAIFRREAAGPSKTPSDGGREARDLAEGFVRGAAGSGSWNGERTLAWDADGLVVQQTAGAHERIREALDLLQRNGLKQLVLECQVMATTEAAVRAAGIEWHVLPHAIPDSESTHVDPRRGVWMQRSVALPALYATLHGEESEQFAASPDVRHLSEPKLVTLNGQVAVVQIGQNMPFKTLNASGELSVRELTCGQTCSFQPVLLTDSDVQLNCRLEFTEVASMNNELVPIGGEQVEIQIPEVRSKVVSGSTRVRLGKTLVLRGPKSNENSLTVVLIKVSRAEELARIEQPKSAEATRTSAVQPVSEMLFARVYSVADLVIPLPRGDRNETAGDPPGIDFRPLTALITATIAPESWDSAGGKGAIQPYPSNLSLVISQDAAVHEKIAELLEQMREMLDVQIVLSPRLIRMTSAQFERLAGTMNLSPNDAGSWILRPQATKALLAEAPLGDHSQQLPRVTTFNEQAVTLKCDDGPELQLVGSITGDRASVRLSLAVGAAPRDVLQSARSLDVEHAQAALFEITDQVAPERATQHTPVGAFLRHTSRRTSDQLRTFCLIRPEIVVQTEARTAE